MTSRTTTDFRAAFRALAVHVQEQARQAYRTFASDPQHPGLRFKLVSRAADVYSARVGLGYPALAARQGDVWLWFWIGSHAEYDRLLRSLYLHAPDQDRRMITERSVAARRTARSCEHAES
jgi:hypothetical protein